MFVRQDRSGEPRLDFVSLVDSLKLGDWLAVVIIQCRHMQLGLFLYCLGDLGLNKLFVIVA
jgi:hypothetical protein